MFLRGRRFEPPRAGMTAKASAPPDDLLTQKTIATHWAGPDSIGPMGGIREMTNRESARGVIYFDLGWASLPSLLGNCLGRREAWFFRTSIHSRAGRRMIKLFGLKPIDLDAMPWLDIGPHSLAEPMGRAIDRLDAMPLDSVLQRLARRYPIAQDAAGILRTSLLRAMAARAVDAFYAQTWARSRGYLRVKVVGVSRWDTTLLDDRAQGMRVTGSVSRACATIGDVLHAAWGLADRVYNKRSKDVTQGNEPSTGEVPASGKPTNERSVLLVLNMGSSYGGLYSYDYLFSDEPDSALHRENVVVIARTGGAGNSEGLVLGHPSSGSRLTQLRIRAGVLAGALTHGDLRVPIGILGHLAEVCARVDGQRREIARYYPSLRLAILAYDVQVPSELVLALESLDIPTAALNERPQSVIWGIQPFSVSTLLTASSFFSKAALESRSVSVNSAVAIGMWRTDLLYEYRARPVHEDCARAHQAGQRFVVALPYHAAAPGTWSNNPLAVGVQSVTHFLEDLAELAEGRPDLFIVIRGKNAGWVADERFSGIAARIDALPNITVSRDYESLNESYRLCAAADLVIAKHTSLVDEVLALGIPCVLHDYTQNSQDLARNAVRYLPRRLWAENPSELRDLVDFALEGGGAAFQEWWEPHRSLLYENLSDGGVRTRARAYLTTLVEEGRSSG